MMTISISRYIQVQGELVWAKAGRAAVKVGKTIFEGNILNASEKHQATAKA